MYLYDPVRGARRRAALAAQLAHVLRIERELFERARKDAENRLRGILDQIRSPRAAQVSDEVLEPRVRSKLGHCVSHARAVLVDVVDGHVTLAGPILAHEADHLVSEVAAIRGVKEVLDALDRHQTAEGVAALAGEGKPVRRRRTQWSPIGQFAAVGLGSILVTWGLIMRRGVTGWLAAAAGGALAVRGTVNRPLGSLTRGAVVRRHRPRTHRKRGPSAHILH
ncbi:MAG TPA: hypothetical protein VFT22_20115 [Kofleriaceae bacterium]|nr:hypothetical protein [Kofleriaceae bacterium]